jgi:hypothetical protein
MKYARNVGSNIPPRVREAIIIEARAAADQFTTPKARRKAYLRSYNAAYDEYMKLHSEKWRAKRLAQTARWRARRVAA